MEFKTYCLKEFAAMIALAVEHGLQFQAEGCGKEVIENHFDAHYELEHRVYIITYTGGF